MNRDEQQEYISERITLADVEQWHEGWGATPHLEKIMNEAGVTEIQVWGSPDEKGGEPLTVIVNA